MLRSFLSLSLSLSLHSPLSLCHSHSCCTLFKLHNLLHNLTLEINCKCDSGDATNSIKERRLCAFRLKRATHASYLCVCIYLQTCILQIHRSAALGDWPAAICWLSCLSVCLSVPSVRVFSSSLRRLHCHLTEAQTAKHPHTHTHRESEEHSAAGDEPVACALLKLLVSCLS